MLFFHASTSLDRFDFSVHHVPGKDLHTTDALSFQSNPDITRGAPLADLAELYMKKCVAHLAAS